MTNASEISSVTLVGRRASLMPVLPEHYRAIYNAVMRGEFPWQWHGMPTSLEAFPETLWSRALCNYLIVRNETGDVAGLVTLYGANFANGTAYVQSFLFAPFRRRAWPLEGAELLINHAFHRYDLRKLYGEVTAEALPQFSSAVERGYVTIEGTLREHVYANGRYTDVSIIALWRDAWDRKNRD